MALEKSVDPAHPDDEYVSAFLGAAIVVRPGVFSPAEAEALVLPLLRDHAAILAGKRVLDIGAGSGILGLYAAQHGASRVVATDIDTAAIASIEENARRLGLSDRVEARLVVPPDLTAYSVLEEGEKFDLILSNPPYSLDLDADQSTPVVDSGDLGFSIVRELDHHLSDDGVALLFYQSLFYHHVMVELARHLGYQVHHHEAPGITSWELGALFDLYLDRIEQREGLPEGSLGVEASELPFLYLRRPSRPSEPLLDASTTTVYPGFIAIRLGLTDASSSEPESPSSREP